MYLRIIDSLNGFQLLLNDVEIKNVQEYRLTNSVDKEPELTIRLLLDDLDVNLVKDNI